MRVLLILLGLGLSSSYANSSYSQTKINIAVKDASLIEFIEEIQSNTEFVFFYKDDILNDHLQISVNLEKASLEKVLQSAFLNTSLAYKISDKQVIIKKLVTKPNKLTVTNLIAQQETITVTGKVTEADTGMPVPAANILETGTSNGVMTDFDGNYSIEVPGDAILQISYIGYATQEVEINDRNEIDIVLETDAAGLDEVIVVGYGQVRKSDLTGSVSSVKGDDITLQAVDNPVQALSGAASGVQVLQNSGQPGSDLSVLIRGGNSLLGGNNPLYVVDGFPMVGDISSINPNDIESIEILKDASSTAIYGSRGANGVVLVTTKSGKEGKTSVVYNGYLGLQQMSNTIDMLNAVEFATLANVRASNDGMEPYFSEAEITSFGAGTDWQDEVFREALIQNHSVTVSGGNDKTLFNVSGNYFSQDGIIINSGYKYLQLSANFEHKINSKWKITLNNIFNRKKSNSILSNNMERGQGVLSGAIIAPPTVPIHDDNGNYSFVRPYPFSPDILEHPLALALERKQLGTTNSLLSNLNVEGNLATNLVLKSSVGIQYDNTRDDIYSPSIFQSSATGSATIAYRELTAIVNENLLTYSATIDEDHDFAALGGVTFQETTSQYVNASSRGFLSDVLENNSLQSGSTPGMPGSGNSESTILSGLGRLNYSYKGKYLITSSFRADGSSVFGVSNKWGYFPSLALAWQVGKEAFLVDNDKINRLKLRASWGKTGNTSVAPYQSLAILLSTQAVFDDNLNIGYAPSGAKPNPDLKWETTDQLNIGADIGFFRNRFLLTLDYYSKKTHDLLASIPVIPSSGYSIQATNLGSMQNKGFELSLNSTVFDGSFTWNLGGNFSMNRNKVLSLPEGGDIFGVSLGNALPAMSLVREGHPVGVFYGLEEDGLTEDGAIKYVDSDGNGEINSLDRQIIGDPNPDYIFGINSSMTYKNFALDVLVNGVQGNDILNYNLSNVADGFSFGLNQIQDVLGNYWTEENPNPNAKYPKISQNTRYQGSDRFIEDGSYIRIQNVRLSYTLKEGLFESSLLKNSQIYFNVQNLATFTDYSFYSPTNNTRGSGISKGIDQFGYPDTRTFMLGFKVNL